MINSNFMLKTLVLACCFLSGATMAGHINGGQGHGNSGNGGGGGNQVPADLVDQMTCQVSDIQLTYIRALVPPNSPQVPIVPIDARACYGMVTGNNSNFENPIDNLGYAGDGWFNDPSGIWPTQPAAFINNDDLLDLDDDGQVDDPGWVYMGKDDGQGFKGAKIPDPDPLDGINQEYKFVDDLFSCSTTQDGSYGSCVNFISGFWKFTPPSTQPELLFDLLGGSFFDQVAVVFKGGNGFVMYNFNLSQLGLDPILAGDTKYEFGGYFSLPGALNNGGGTPGLSNISLWARDPFSPNDVAEPGYLALIGIVLLMMYRRRNRSRLW